VCVFSSHYRPLGPIRWLGGSLAVELFFVVSGFYMQLVLSTRYTKAKLGTKWIAQFYKARYFRLLPTYLAGSLVALAGAALLRPPLSPLTVWTELSKLPATPTNQLFKTFLGFTDATMLFPDATMFFAAHHGVIHWSSRFFDTEIPLWEGLPVPPGWSLGIELSFYLLAPWLLNLRSRWLVAAAACCLAIKMTVVQSLHLMDPWTYRFFPFELGYFLLGALAFRYRTCLGSLLPSSKYLVYPLVICLTAIRAPVPAPTLTYPLVLACLLPILFRTTSESKGDRLLGELSYPFYIFHVFAIRAILSVMPRASDSLVVWTGLVLTIMLSIIALALEMRFVEPWRARFGKK
jgi:peptidoglycan/LPS O-acetylase OafA/YrhL